MTKSVHLHRQTRREIRQRLQSGELKGAIIPVGAIEQHLEHLAMEHDWKSVSRIAELTAEALQPNVLVASGLMCGVSEHHMNHPGTLSLRPSTFLAVLGDLIHSMVRAGIQSILVLNGHGGNISPCQGVWDQFQREFKINLHFLSYWEVLNKEDAELLVTGDLPGHAQEFETAIAMAAFPKNIRSDAMSEQADKTPLLATAEAGDALLNRIVTRVAKYLGKMLDGENTQPTPAYFP